MTITVHKTMEPGRRTAKWFVACRTAILEVMGYAVAIFLAEMLVKIWMH